MKSIPLARLVIVLAATFLALAYALAQDPPPEGQGGQEPPKEQGAREPPKDQGPALSEQDQREVDIGKDGVKEVEAESKPVTDAAILERVQRVGAALAEVARTQAVPAKYGYDRLSPFQYEFHVLQDDDINAFALPGGFVFVNTGLLDFVESDDELAGVLAHEIAHASHHHMMRLVKDLEKTNQESVLGAILIGALAGGGSENLVNVFTGLQAYQIARSNAYVQEAEQDADSAAYLYMRASHYNPVAVLTFMERLHAKQKLQPAIDWGIYRTHPPTEERAENVIKLLSKDGVPIRRSAVSTSARVRVRERTEEGKTLQELYLGDIPIVEMATDGAAEDPLARGKAFAETMNRFLDDDPQLYEVKVTKTGEVRARGETLLAFSDADTSVCGMTAEQMAREAQNALRRVLSKLGQDRSLASGL